jgi:hypothetical protein
MLLFSSGQRFPDPLREGAMIFAAQLEIYVEVGPILNENPYQTLYPDEAGMFPWNGGDKQAESNNHSQHGGDFDISQQPGLIFEGESAMLDCLRQ